jgi:hypothetical protein
MAGPKLMTGCCATLARLTIYVTSYCATSILPVQIPSAVPDNQIT